MRLSYVQKRNNKKEIQRKILLRITSVFSIVCFIIACFYGGFYIYQRNQTHQKQMQVLEEFDKTISNGNQQISGNKSTVNLQNQELKVVGAISIPKIAVNLPVFNDSSTAALEIGAGWLPGSSELGGGKSKHAVIDGHTGKSAPLFTRIRDLKKGDKIYLKAKGNILEYEVISSIAHDPTYTDDLQPKKNQDLLTLITCTPIFINTERLHVTAKRIPYDNRFTVQRSVLSWVLDHISEILVVIGVLILVLVLAKVIKNERRK